MTPNSSLRFPTGLRAILATVSVALLLGACAAESTVKSPPKAPASLQPGLSEHEAFRWHGVGTQIYECRASAAGDSWAWVFVAPEADLFNHSNDKVGTHGAGPYWASLDGSQTQGTVKARVDGATPADIPQLLLTAKSNGTAGKMAMVSSVQRLNTVGGVAPAAGCSAAADAGKQVKVPYSADYVFFSAL